MHPASVGCGPLAASIGRLIADIVYSNAPDLVQDPQLALLCTAGFLGGFLPASAVMAQGARGARGSQFCTTCARQVLSLHGLQFCAGSLLALLCTAGFLGYLAMLWLWWRKGHVGHIFAERVHGNTYSCVQDPRLALLYTAGFLGYLAALSWRKGQVQGARQSLVRPLTTYYIAATALLEVARFIWDVSRFSLVFAGAPAALQWQQCITRGHVRLAARSLHHVQPVTDCAISPCAALHY